MGENTIPKDLFPLKENSYTLAWAKHTYPYAHLFALPLEYTQAPNSDNINVWRSKAIQVRAELTSLGKDAGTKKMLEIANVKYNLRIKGTDLPCQSIEDILTIVGDKTWYNSNKDTRINQIYMLIYGLTRQGFNQWLLDLEKDWMKKMNVTYITKTGRQDDFFNSRGSIYSLLKKVFNNNTIKLFKNRMWFHHYEFICVRMKSNVFNHHKVEVKRINCRWGQAYLCTMVTKDSNTNNKMMIQKSDHMFPQIHAEGSVWVRNCVDKGLSIDALHNMVDKWYSDHIGITENHKNDTSKYIIHLVSKLINSYNIVCCVSAIESYKWKNS